MNSSEILKLYLKPDAKDYEIYTFLHHFSSKDEGYFHFFNLLDEKQKNLIYGYSNFQESFLQKINRLPEEEFNSYFFNGFVEKLPRDQIISHFVNHQSNNEKLKKYVIDMETKNKINFDNIILHMSNAYSRKQDVLFNLFLNKYKDKFLNIHKYDSSSRVWQNLNYFLKYSESLEEYLKISKTLYIDNIFLFSNCLSEPRFKKQIDTESKTFKEEVIPMIREIKNPYVLGAFFKSFLQVYDNFKGVEDFLNKNNNPEILTLYSKALVGNIKKINSQTVEKPDSFYIDKYLRLYIKDCKGNFEDWINSVCKRLEIKTCLSNIPQNKKFKI